MLQAPLSPKSSVRIDARQSFTFRHHREDHLELRSCHQLEPAALYNRCEAKRGLSSEQIRAHFLEHGEQLQILPAHRDHVHSGVMNLVKEWPALPTFDLILNRNVLHTFDAPTRVSLLQRTHDQLARDGVLVVGASEGPLIPTIGFEHHTTNGCEYFQTTPDLPRYRDEP